MNYYALIVTTIAGLSTVVGGLIIYINSYNKNKVITNALAFAAGVMITTSIIDLIPNAYSIYTNNYNIFPRIIICLIGINIGIIISILINKYLPDDNVNQFDGKLYRVGVLL